MMGSHKFSLKRLFFVLLGLAFFCALTWTSKASGIKWVRIDSLLTTGAANDTVPKRGRDTLRTADTIPAGRDNLNHPSPRVTTLKNPLDSLADSLHREAGDTNIVQRDTFMLRMSKDTLDAPVEYEAEDSAVVMVDDKKIVLYGSTKTTHKDATLSAPQVTLDQQTNILTAVNEQDSLGKVTARATFQQGENNFESDTIRFNFKTQRGLTKHTYTQQSEMFVHGETIKKVDAGTVFVEGGRFTTCNLDDPHFDFRSKKMKVVNNKVAVTGYVQLAFEDVPLPKPIGLPFGIFPMSRGRHSGLLPPKFTVTENFGLGLEGLGYYKVLNEYLDVTLRGNLYSYGGWLLNLTPTYRKRYRYNGALNLSLQETKQNFKGDPDYSKTRSFFINWNHSVDQRARPGTIFSASVRAGSSKYNTYLLEDPTRYTQNNFGSSIMYQKTWQGKPYNLSLGATHDQNTNTGIINVRLPDATFSVTTIYPLQRKEAIGAAKWYEKLGIGYSGAFQNQLAFYDSTFTVKHLLDTLRWGASHNIPITLALPPLGPFTIAPSVSYQEQWLMQKTDLRWNAGAKKVDTTLQKGFYTARNISTGLSFNTALFGTYNFRNSNVIAIRHVVRPSFSFSYIPNLAEKYYGVYQVDTSGRTQVYNQYIGNPMGSGFSNDRFGGITFGIDNNLEMKVRNKKDTGAAATRIVRLIDGFSIRSGYDLMDTAFKLAPFSMDLRSTLFDKVNLTATATLDPYRTDTFGNRVNQLAWRGAHPNLGRLSYGSIALSTQFRSKPKDPSKAPQSMPYNPTITDPALLADQQRLMDYMQRNPGDFVDFNIPWDIGLDFSLNYSSQFNREERRYRGDVTSSVNFRSSFSLTPKWNFSTSGSYNLSTKDLGYLTMSINRDLHCWQMSIGLVPVGLWRSFSITINPKSGMLQDLRVNRTRQFPNFQ
jgi:lipopolysaccharide export system protein LptA